MSQSFDFLEAVFAAARDSQVRYDGHRVADIEDADADGFETVDGLLPDDRLAYVFNVIETPDTERVLRRELASDQPPTAVVGRDDVLICVYAFDEPRPVDKTVRALAEQFGMDGVDEPIPLPGGKWRLLHADKRTYYTPDELSAPPWEVGPAEAAGRYGDAKIIAPFDETDPALAQEMVVSLGKDTFSKNWKPTRMPIGMLVAMFCQHKVGAKDGPGVVLGDQVPGPRVKTAIKALYAIGLDLDDGVPSAEVDRALKDLGHLAIRYTTHSHLKTRTEITRDALVKWAAKNADAAEVDDDLVHRWMTERDKLDPRIVETARIVGEEHKTAGVMIQVDHAPIPKHRIVIPLVRPFVLGEQGASQQAAQEKWKKVPRALADKLGLPLDEACLDVSRLFYLPRHAKDSPFEISLAGGPLFDWETLSLENPWEDEIASITKGKGRSTTDAGKQLGRWSMKAAHGFQIVQVLEEHAPERMRSQTSTGWEIECPFDEEHSNPGDQDDRACLAVNAGDGPSEIFTISCRHESCRDRTNLDMLGKMVEDQWFEEGVLEDPAYNIAEVEDAPNPEAAVRIDKQDKAVAGWQKAVDALTPESDEETISEAIRTCVEAGLGTVDMARARERVCKQTGLKISALNKTFKLIEAEVAREENEGKGIKDPHGRIVFSFQGEPHFDEAYDVCFRTLKQENRKAQKPVFCCVQDQVVRLTEDMAGKVTFQDLTARSMWAELNDRCTFIRLTDSGAAGPRAQVPTDVASQVFEQAYKRLPQAPEIIYTPLFVKSEKFGVEVVSKAGWYEDLDLLMADTDFRVPEVYADPTPEEVQDALWLLADEVLGDFPFLDHDLNDQERREPSLANALAMIITPFMRRLIEGCTPVFFITKPTPGTGGTLLGQVPIVLCDGEEPAPEPYTQNEEEMRKALLASIMETRSHLFYDDVRDFNNRVLLQSITARHIGGRLLGATKTVQRPNRFNWIATGNNPNVQNEMERRVVWIRLNAKTNDIQNRKFRHPDYMQWLKRERSAVVHAILTLIQNWVSLGMPKFVERKRASFEDWSEKVGGVLMSADVDDEFGLFDGFLNNRRALGADSDEAAVRAFVRAWHDRWGQQHITPAEMFAHALDNDMDICDGNNDDQKKSRFYRRLPLLDGRTFKLHDQDFMVRMGSNSDQDTTYFLEPLVMEEAA